MVPVELVLSATVKLVLVLGLAVASAPSVFTATWTVEVGMTKSLDTVSLVLALSLALAPVGAKVTGPVAVSSAL